MREEWKDIDEFPGYGVSNRGRVASAHSDRGLTPSPNQRGIPTVGMVRDGKQFRRAVAPLVAHAFLPEPEPPFDTPINLDGDRNNCRVENLAWRPRWFAVQYHMQFEHPFQGRLNIPIMECDTEEVFENSLEAARKYGLLERQLVLATLQGDFVWPTGQEFVIV